VIDMAELIKLFKKSDIQPGQVKSAYVPSISNNVAVTNIGGKYYAFMDECPHMAYRLSNGTVEGSVLTCPQHGSKFDMTTGKALAVSDRPLTMYEVKIEGDDIYLTV
jgi:3-phenylpropionate/trans-cinnamate dioxygenase ferredoxin component